VLTPDGLATLVTVEETLLGELDGQMRTDVQGRPRVYTLSTPLLEALAAQGVDLADADGRQIGAATTAVLTEQPRLTALLSADLDAEKGQARATTVLVELDPELTTEQRLDALERVRADLGIEEGELRGEVDGLLVTVNSPEGTNAALESETQSEAPMLLLLALLAVIVVLGVLLRSAFDVMVGMLALAATLIWTFGIIAILGPEVLDLLGPLSQIGVVVPVLIIGLGIDYAVHLLSRYHEQRATGQVPSLAAATSMGTVGTALVLATVATAAGFAMTGLAPLSVIADFGIFTAIGVIVALVVMGGAVPAARCSATGGVQRPDRHRKPRPASASCWPARPTSPSPTPCRSCSPGSSSSPSGRWPPTGSRPASTVPTSSRRTPRSARSSPTRTCCSTVR
jgi:uncharacterized protein